MTLTKLMLLVLLFIAPTITLSQNSKIAGKVIDEETGDELISATVILKDKSNKIVTGAQTKYDGTFLLKKVKPGIYKLTVNYVGYQTKTVDSLEIESGKDVSLDLSLKTDAIMTQEVVVEARAIKDNSAALLKDRQKSASSQDAIGAQEMSSKGASDAGDALKKVTGVTIKDNKTLVVRGLSNRYAKTQLNGAALPSADPDSRSVDLDMFSTGMIENIVTIKTATPDKPGDFTGGAVDIKTKSYPDKFFVTVGMSTNYNFQVTGNDLLIGEQSKTDWLGMDDGSRGMPTEVDNLIDKYGDRIPDANEFFFIDDENWVDVNNDGLQYIDENSNGIRDRESYQDLNSNGRWDSGEPYEDANNSGRFDYLEETLDQGEMFSTREIITDLNNGALSLEKAGMAPINITAPVSTGFSFGIGNQYKIGKSTPIGFSANLNYNRSYNSYENGIFSIWELTNFIDDSLRIIDHFSDTKGEENVLLGGMFNVTTTLFDFNEFSVNLIYNQASTNTGRYISGRRPGSSGLPNKGFSSWSNRFTERNLYTFQFGGKHKLDFLKYLNIGNSKLDWQLSTSENSSNVPDFRLFAYDWEPENVNNIFNSTPNVDTLNTIEDRAYNSELDGAFDPTRDSLDYSVARYGINISNYNQPARIFRSMNESNVNFSANLEVPLDEFFGIPFSFKTGTLIERIDRSFNEKWITYNPNKNSFPTKDVNGDDFVYNPNQDPNSAFERLVGFDTTGSFVEPVMYLGYQPEAVNSYTASQDVNAFYGMIDFKIFNKLRIITGVRVENSELLALPQDTSAQTLNRFRGEYAIVNGINPDDSSLDSIYFEDFGINTTDLLPSINLVYGLNKKSNLRAAYYKTLARPNMREMAPYSSFDFIGGFLNNGNPFLERVLVNNYDLRYEWFPNSGELVAVSIYYKDFTNPIERGIVSANNQIRYLNAESAELLGAEFEIRKNFGKLIETFGAKAPKFFNYLDLSFNLTLTDAEVSVPRNSRDADALIDNQQDILNYNRSQDSLAIIGAGGNDFSQLPDTLVDTNSVLKRDFVGQSPYVLNFDISYSNPNIGLNISTNFNVFGRRLDFVQLGRNPDVYELPRPDLNIVVSKSFFNDLKLKLSINNILNPYTQLSQEYKGTEYYTTRYRRGSSVSLGMSYTFN
ncbi:TonB-dependent receptor [Candidatus Kapabacteria bacterium]|nr:TonB-dependent receptor [Candidatus Kapabacteria bacterium]